MDKNKIFFPVNQLGIDVTHPSRYTEREKKISLLNGELLNIKLTIINYHHDLYRELDKPLWGGFSSMGRFYFTPTCLSGINLDFNLFNKKGDLVSDFSWQGFYFDISSKMKKNLFEKELNSALQESIIFCLNNDLTILLGNFEELNIPDRIQKNEGIYYSSHIECNIHLLMENLYSTYFDLVKQSNDELEKINLNLGLIQNNKVLSGEIEKFLKINSYDSDELILTNGAFANFWNKV